jgi:hypothetical protein
MSLVSVVVRVADGRSCPRRTPPALNATGAALGRNTHVSSRTVRSIEAGE